VAYVIPGLAALLFLVSLALFLFSGLMQKLLYIFFDEKWVNVVIVFRMLAGFIIIGAAPASGAPVLMIFVGIVIIFVAFTTPFMSSTKLHELGEWWLSLHIMTIKFWALLWMIIWFLLCYIASPESAFYSVYISSYLNSLLDFWLQSN